MVNNQSLDELIAEIREELKAKKTVDRDTPQYRYVQGLGYVLEIDNKQDYWPSGEKKNLNDDWL
jgi:hypothetical protein